MKRSPLQHFILKDVMEDTTHKIVAEVTNLEEEAICDAIVAEALRNGVHSVFLMDRAFVISALKKQIPRKPIPEYSKAFGLVLHHSCPNCKNSGLGKGNRFSHCEYCGQALDWGE